MGSDAEFALVTPSSRYHQHLEEINASPFVAVKLLAWRPPQPVYRRRHSWKGRLDHALNVTTTISKHVSRVLEQRSLCGGGATGGEKRHGMNKADHLMATERDWPDSSGLLEDGLACQPLMKSWKQLSLGLESPWVSLTWVGFITGRFMFGCFRIFQRGG